MRHVAEFQPLVKRLPTTIDFRHDITRYGLDNLYPQRIEEIIKRSPVTTKATNSFSNFLKGQGFFENGDEIVNDKGEKFNKILKLAAEDFSKYEAFAIHVNVNVLNGITSLKNIPFKYVRYGLPNEKGKHKDVKVSVNWEHDQFKTSRRGGEDVFTFPLWDFVGRTEEFKLDASNGFVFYFTPEDNQYPLSTADPVLDSSQTEADIQSFELGSIQNGFLGTSIFKYPGEFNSDKERKEFKEDLQQLTGAKNSGSVMLIETPEDFDGEVIEQVPANNSDTLFALTGNNVVDRVVMLYGVPLPIMAIQPNGGLFNQEETEDAFVYYNSFTREPRTVIYWALQSLADVWHLGPIELTGIIESQFTTQIEEITQDKLIALIKEVKSGVISFETAINILLDLYGANKERARKLLGKIEVEPIKPGDGSATNN